MWEERRAFTPHGLLAYKSIIHPHLFSFSAFVTGTILKLDVSPTSSTLLLVVWYCLCFTFVRHPRVTGRLFCHSHTDVKKVVVHIRPTIRQSKTKKVNLYPCSMRVLVPCQKKTRGGMRVLLPCQNKSRGTSTNSTCRYINERPNLQRRKTTLSALHLSLKTKKRYCTVALLLYRCRLSYDYHDCNLSV